MPKLNFAEALDAILKRDPRFDRDAYLFIREGLDHTMKVLKRNARGTRRHVRGQELLEGVRLHALDQFGPMAMTVLNHWGIRQCEDFGAIVFNMVEQGILGKSDEDSLDDFHGGYDFHEAFVKPFQPPTRAAAPPRHPADGRRGDHFPAPGRQSDPDKEKLSNGPN